MLRIALRYVALLVLAIGLYELWSARTLVQLSLRGGWTLYPPGIYEHLSQELRVGAVLTLTAAVVAIATFIPQRRHPPVARGGDPGDPS